jgi:hypothetical protein
VADEVRLDLGPSLATFRWRDEHLSLVPTVYVTPRTGRLQRFLLGSAALVSVGAAPANGTVAHEVRLFDPASEPPEGIGKADCLELFLRQALKRLFARSRFRIKPSVEVYGSRQVATALGGYQEVLLRKALLTAGASQVEFHS